MIAIVSYNTPDKRLMHYAETEMIEVTIKPQDGRPEIRLTILAEGFTVTGFPEDAEPRVVAFNKNINKFSACDPEKPSTPVSDN